MAYHSYDYRRRPSTIYEDDETDSYYRPSIHSASPRMNLADLPDSSFIDYDLGEDRESLNEYDDGRSPTPVGRYTPSPLGRTAGSRNSSYRNINSGVEREVPEFDAATTSRAHYTWKDPQKSENVRSSTPTGQSVPFYADTTNRDHYTWKDPEKRTKRASPSERELPPFYDETTHKSEFVTKIPTKEKSIKQPTHRSNEVPFYSETSHQAHYPPKQRERARAIKRSNTIGLDGDIASKTTTNETFQHKVAAKQKSLRPSDSNLFGGDGSFATTHKQTFTPKETNRCPAEYYISKREKLHHVGNHYYIRHLQKIAEDQPVTKRIETKTVESPPKVVPQPLVP